MSDRDEVVRLLAGHGLAPQDDEFASLVAAYASSRAGLAALYRLTGAECAGET